MSSRIGCHDSNCIWERPQGVQTNGGCKCTRELERNSRDYSSLTDEQKREHAEEWRKLRRNIIRQRDRINELETVLLDYDEDMDNIEEWRDRVYNVLHPKPETPKENKTE